MANLGLQLPRPPGQHSLHGKYTSCAKKSTSSYHQWHRVPGSWGRGEAEMKCGGRRRCEQLAMFFHSTGGTANLFPCSIYGSKQDANSRIEVVCHMQPHCPVWTEIVERGEASFSTTKAALNHVLCITRLRNSNKVTCGEH